MSDFDDWFKRREGVPPAGCPWLRTFLNSRDPDEVLRIFELHQGTLVTNEMVEELEGSYQIMSSRHGDLNALMTRGLIVDRIDLIRDAQAHGMPAAINHYQASQAK